MRCAGCEVPKLAKGLQCTAMPVAKPRIRSPNACRTRTPDDLANAADLRSRYWRMLTGTSASAELQSKTWFRRMAPKTLLINGAALSQGLLERDALVTAPCRASVASHRTLARVAWLHAAGVPRCVCTVRPRGLGSYVRGSSLSKKSCHKRSYEACRASWPLRQRRCCAFAQCRSLVLGTRMRWSEFCALANLEPDNNFRNDAGHNIGTPSSMPQTQSSPHGTAATPAPSPPGARLRKVRATLQRRTRRLRIAFVLSVRACGPCCYLRCIYMRAMQPDADASCTSDCSSAAIC